MVLLSIAFLAIISANSAAIGFTRSLVSSVSNSASRASESPFAMYCKHISFNA